MKAFFALLLALIALSYEGTPIINSPPTNVNQQPPFQPGMNQGGMYGGYPYYYPGMDMGYDPWGFDEFNPWGDDDYDNDWDWDWDLDWNRGHRSKRKHHHNHNHNQNSNNTSSSSKNRKKNKKRNTASNSRPSTPRATPTPTPTPSPTRDIAYGEGTMAFNPSPQNYMNYGDNFMPYGASGRQSSSMIPQPVVNHNVYIRGGKNESPDKCKIEGKFKQLCLKKEAMPVDDKSAKYEEYYDCFEESVCKYVKDECKWLQTKRFKQCMSSYKQFIYDKHKYSHTDL